MCKKQWSVFDSVGDQSGHISAMVTLLSQWTPIVKGFLNSPKSFRMVSDKLSE